MIHGSSTDPVIIKKINLRIWHLKDEIRAVIANRLVKNQNATFTDLTDEYSESGDKSHLTLIDGGKTASNNSDSDDGVISEGLIDGEDDAEALMAAAIAEGDSGAGEIPEGEIEGEDDAEALMAAAIAEGNSNGEEIAEGQIDGEDDAEALMAAAIAEGDPEAQGLAPAPELTPVVNSGSQAEILQRRPKLPKDKFISGKLILSEISMDGLYFFSSQRFLEGQSVIIEFLIPTHFSISAEVLFCRQYNMKSRIIGPNKLPYRIGAKFTFLKPGEKTLLRQFVASIEPEVQEVVKKVVTKPTSDEDDDDDVFDDLDDLDI